MENTNKRQKMHLNPNVEKSATKLENRQESALILEKELFKKIPLNTAYTRIAFYVSIWLKGVCPFDINATPKIYGSHKSEPFSFSYPVRPVATLYGKSFARINYDCQVDRDRLI